MYLCSGLLDTALYFACFKNVLFSSISSFYRYFAQYELEKKNPTLSEAVILYNRSTDTSLLRNHKLQQSERFIGTELTTWCQHRLRCFVSLRLWFWLSMAPAELWKEWSSFILLLSRGSRKEFTNIAKRLFFILQSSVSLYFGQMLAKFQTPGLQ